MEEKGNPECKIVVASCREDRFKEKYAASAFFLAFEILCLKLTECWVKELL